MDPRCWRLLHLLKDGLAREEEGPLALVCKLPGLGREEDGRGNDAREAEREGRKCQLADMREGDRRTNKMIRSGMSSSNVERTTMPAGRSLQ